MSMLRALRSGLSVALAAAGVAVLRPSASPAQDTLGPISQDFPRRETAEEFTARITAQLRARSPGAARVFAAANAAAESGRYEEAEAGYRRVLVLAPGFDHAVRRLCMALVAQRRRSEGLVYCRQALAADRSRENLSALAYALAVRIEGDAPTPEAAGEAVALSRELVADPGAGAYEMRSACVAALTAQDLGLLRACQPRLAALAPGEIATAYFGIVLAVSEGRWHEADTWLDRAAAAGMSPADVAELRLVVASKRPWGPRLAMAGVWAGAGWAVLMLVLLAAGLVLSAVTLRASQRVAATPAAEPVPLTAGLRRAYRVVLWLACLLYYLSLPLVVLAVVGGGALAVMGLWALGWAPVNLLALIVIVVLVSLGAVLKSLFVRADKGDPGVRLDLSVHPRLGGVLGEVAQAIGTRPVDNVYLTPGTDLAVMERGGVLSQMRGGSERCLILGVGGLEGLRLGPFKAILAHEYGHFSNRDTAGGGFAIAVRRSVWVMAVGLARGGAAAWYNPAWLFVNAFYRVFLRVSQGASRLQEVLADRWAALAYGAAAFESGLRHLIARAVEFEARADAVLKEVIDRKAPLLNLYAYQPEKGPAPADVAQAVAAALEAAPAPYDSHPAPSQRVAWARAITAPPTGDLGDADAEVWDLFADRAAIEAQMTGELRANLLKAHGIEIAAAT